MNNTMQDIKCAEIVIAPFRDRNDESPRRGYVINRKPGGLWVRFGEGERAALQWFGWEEVTA